MNTNALEFIDALRAKRAALAGTVRRSDLAVTHTLFAVDASGSMAGDDFPPTRYLAGVEAVGNFLAVRAALFGREYFGALVFNDVAKVLCEAEDYSHMQGRILRDLRRIAPDGGTDIGAALQAAALIFKAAAPADTHRLILLSDGHGGRPYREADQLKRQGVVIDTIGIGGSPVEVDETCLKTIASLSENQPRYRFITDKDDLVNHFRTIAHELVLVRP